MEIRAGKRLASSVCETNVVVIRATTDEVDLRCGGHPMAPIDAVEKAGEPAAGFDQETLIGKRYFDEDTGVEVMCTSAGVGSLSIGDRLIEAKSAKPLPSTD